MNLWWSHTKTRLYPFWAYFRFLTKATNAHGIHSPFVYDLVTNCFYDKKPQKAYTTLNRYRAQLKNDRTDLQVTDFGAGSRVFRSGKRSVRHLARHVGVTQSRQRLLLRLAHYFTPQNSLELGTHLGLGTAALSLGQPQGHITTVEGCPALAQRARTGFDDYGLNNITIIQERFDLFLKNLSHETYDLIYLDGNHQKYPTLAYFEILKQHCSAHSVMIFDDIHWSADMADAWEIIKQDPSVTVSIDTFYWGLIFFRPGQAKEHFVVRA